MNSVRVDMWNFDPETGMGTAKIVFADRNLKDSVKLVQEYTGRYAYLDDQSLQTLEFRKGACPAKHIPKDITCALVRAVRTNEAEHIYAHCVCACISIRSPVDALGCERSSVLCRNRSCARYIYSTVPAWSWP